MGSRGGGEGAGITCDKIRWIGMNVEDIRTNSESLISFSKRDKSLCGQFSQFYNNFIREFKNFI